ncbi:MAG: SAM-dependent methyltransferase [Coprococcus sp.]|nr:SAM-dependent methyltransferase [Coprococcus sp.]
MKNIDLSIRMKAVADMTVTGHTVADIGCDHAFVPIYLIKNKISSHVIASDVRSGPCDIARRNIDAYGLSDVIDLRLGDGLDTIEEGEADTIIIAGMGGMLINSILDKGYKVAASAKQLILQPQSDIDKVRNHILDKGWTIVSEDMLVDMGKYYTILNIATNPVEFDYKVRRADENLTDLKKAYLKYGRYLIEHGNPVLKEYLLGKRAANQKLILSLHHSDSEKSRLRYEELLSEQKVIDAALELITSHT